MGGVFVNYRTGDSEWAAYLIARALVRRFGAHQVFYASTSIEVGEDFRRRIESRVPDCDVLISVIGPRWLEPEPDGTRRIDDPEDWVHKELRLAFENDVHIIPVLLDDTPRLLPERLPADIADLAHRQFIRLRHRERDDHDLLLLLDEVADRLPEHATEPWRVRVHDLDGRVRGAGVLLGDEHVLTSARVLAGAGAEVKVSLAGRRRIGAIRARARPEWRIPATDGRRGDVALLRLARPAPRGAGTTLHRTALSWDRAVRVCGFPRGMEDGVYVRATLLDHGGAGDWVRMRTAPGDEQRIGAGFGGAGVVDDESGDVLGIVVGGYGEAAELSWMIPAEAILHHLPLLADWVTGDAVADDVFSEPYAHHAGHDDPAGHAETERALTEWLSRRDTGERVKIVAGPATAALYRIVSRFSRELRLSTVSSTASFTGSPPPDHEAGTIDVAVDASGKTAWDVARRVLSRAGVRTDDLMRPGDRLRRLPPMTVVVTGVDEAAEPDRLLTEVLEPLAHGEGRLLLGFRAEDSPGLALARTWDTLGDRLERLAARIAELEAAERRLMALRARVLDPVPPRYRGARLRAAAGVLRGMAERGEEAELPELLERCERRTAHALREAADHEARLREAADECDDLLGMLDAYQAKAFDHGLAEDAAIAALYRGAHDLLADRPVDLPAAREAVRRHRQAVRQATSGPDVLFGDDLAAEHAAKAAKTEKAEQTEKAAAVGEDATAARGAGRGGERR